MISVAPWLIFIPVHRPQAQVRAVTDPQFKLRWSQPSLFFPRALTIRIICTNPKTDPTMTPAINSQ